MSQTVELPRVGGPGSGLEDNWRVIVLNDNHNTFEGVAFALSSTLPGVSYDDGMAMANTIHTKGQAIVWTGDRETAGALLGAAEGRGAHDGPARAGLAPRPSRAAQQRAAEQERRAEQRAGAAAGSR